jgi:hypothetical protein
MLYVCELVNRKLLQVQLYYFFNNFALGSLYFYLYSLHTYCSFANYDHSFYSSCTESGNFPYSLIHSLTKEIGPLLNKLENHAYIADLTFAHYSHFPFTRPLNAWLSIFLSFLLFLDYS